MKEKLELLLALGFTRAEILAAVLGGGQPDPLIGAPVIIRDHMAGVFVGTLDRIEGKLWQLSNARKIHYWTKAGAVEGLAGRGFGADSRITCEVAIVCGCALVQVVACTPTEHAALMAAKEWLP